MPFSIIAQETGSITGNVAGADDKAAIPFSNVAILDATSKRIITGATSDGDGVFVLSAIDTGNYDLVISFIGYKSDTLQNIKLITRELLNIGTVFLKAQRTELNEIEVIAERPTIEQGVGKTTLNVNDNLASASESALDLIDYLPSASKDEENNVLLRGAPATILIDGVETDLTNILESLPAGAIDKIEIITNPSAKYSSQNGAGIINIVLKKDKLKGANGRANLALGSPQKIQAGTNLMLKFKKWTSFSNINYIQFNDEIYSLSKRITETETDTSFLNSEGNNNRHLTNISASQGFKYQISKSSSLHLKGSYRNNVNEYTSKYVSKRFLVDSVTRSHNQNTTEGSTERNYWNASINYKKQFSSISNLELTVKHEKQSNSYPLNKVISYFDVNTGEQKENYATQKRNKPENIYSNRLQFDFEQGINSKLKLETGTLILQRKSEVLNDYIKTSYRPNESQDAFDVVIDSSQYYNFRVQELQPSVYALLLMETKDWSFTGGMRYEFIHQKTGSSTNDSSHVNQFNNILPSLQLSRRFENKFTLGFSATLRTKMPKYHQLNPVVVYHGLYSKSAGNPFLKPEKISNIELTSQKLFKKHSINTSLFYKHFSDMISVHQHIVVEDGNDILFREYQNIGEVKQLGAELIMNSRFEHKFHVKLNLMALGQKIQNSYKGNFVSIDDISYSGKLTMDQTFWKDYKWQITGIYNSPLKTISGEKFELYYVNAGLRKSFFNNKASINLKVNDLFNTLEREKLNTTSINFVQSIYSKNISRKYLVSVSYKFNTMAKKS